MKKILAFIFLTVALAMTAVNYRISFNECISNGKLTAADSILNEWSRITPEDPELFPARFNLFLNRARSEMVVLSDESAQKGTQLILNDNEGNNVGFIRSEVTWQDSLVNCAFAEIDRGIAAFPDRIDFRLGKAAAATMAGRWNDAIEVLDAMMDRNTENGGHWTGSENAVLTDTDTILAEAVFERLADIYNSEMLEAVEMALPLSDKAAKHFGNNVKILNLSGAMNMAVGNSYSALVYFEKASSVDPNDAVPLTNIAYIKYQQGDSSKALEIYREIEKGNYDEDSREFARQMIAEISTPVQDMQEYFYFFRYLPQIAASVPDPTAFLNVEMINSSIPAYNKYRSPFADADIEVYDVPQQDGDLKVVVWTFPMPREIPMCRYIAFVSDTAAGCKILTLEKSLEECWVIGSITGADHSNFGNIPLPADAASFVKTLHKKNLLQ